MCLAYQSGSESVRYSPINPCNEISQEVAESFNGATFTKTTLTEDTVMYRVSGGNAGKVGSYVSRTSQGGGLQSQLDLAQFFVIQDIDKFVACIMTTRIRMDDGFSLQGHSMIFYQFIDGFQNEINL